MEQPAPMRVERLQQRRGEAARTSRGPVPAGMSASVVISTCGVLKPSIADRLADDRVLDLVDRLDVLRASSTSGRCPSTNGRITVT